MRKIYARLPDGQIVSRQTYKSYTHVVVARNLENSWFAVRWTRQPADALNRATGQGYRDARLIDVEER